MTALGHSRIGIVLYAESTTSKNLARDGRLTLTFLLGRGLCEVRLRAIEKEAGGQYRYFIATVEDVREHLAHSVPSGLTFRLHDPASVIKRWKSQIASNGPPIAGVLPSCVGPLAEVTRPFWVDGNWVSWSSGHRCIGREF
jgi:hypothetical protein